MSRLFFEPFGHFLFNLFFFVNAAFFLVLFKRRKPEHIHVMCQNGEAKFWLSPKIELANNYELSKTQIKEIKNIIEENYDKFKDAWKNHKED